MYKDKSKEREAARERKRRQRDKGVTLATKGVTQLTSDTTSEVATKRFLESEGVTQGVTPDMLHKLTDPVWRRKLEAICHAFRTSHHPDYVNDVWLGNYNLSTVCELLEVTA